MLRCSISGLTVAAGLLLAACAGPGGPEAARISYGNDCVALFRHFDMVEARMSTPSGFNDQRSVPTELQLPIMWLRQADCLTRGEDLVLGGPVVPFQEGGPTISPETVHAGVVTDMSDDARVKAWFQARGVPVRSEGQAGLGRRIYLGPVTTAGGRDTVFALARDAGFRSPYVKSY